jgi:hypothetical protein
MQKITLKLLEELDACKEGVSYFTREHGESATLDEVLRNPRLDPDHAFWLGQYLPADYMTWEARLAVQCDNYHRAALGRDCPVGVEGATWEARLAVQRDDIDRALLGGSCPPGVEGVTLEARLAVQLDDWGRKYVLKNFGGESCSN